MGTEVQRLKHAAKVQEWSARIAECRGSGIGVKAWFREHGIALKTYYKWEREIVKEATQKYALVAAAQVGMLVKVNPDTMASDDVNAIETIVTIRHGEGVITLQATVDRLTSIIKEGACAEKVLGVTRVW